MRLRFNFKLGLMSDVGFKVRIRVRVGVRIIIRLVAGLGCRV